MWLKDWCSVVKYLWQNIYKNTHVWSCAQMSEIWGKNLVSHLFSHEYRCIYTRYKGQKNHMEFNETPEWIWWHVLEIEHLSFRGMFILNSRESPVINYRSTQTTLTFFLYLIHFKPCPFGVELPNCTFLMELLKIVSLIQAGEDCWAGASAGAGAGALSLCYIVFF